MVATRFYRIDLGEEKIARREISLQIHCRAAQRTLCFRSKHPSIIDSSFLWLLGVIEDDQYHHETTHAPVTSSNNLPNRFHHATSPAHRIFAPPPQFSAIATPPSLAVYFVDASSPVAPPPYPPKHTRSRAGGKRGTS